MYQAININDTYQERSDSMILSSAIRGTSSTHYSLNRIQIDHLVNFIFSRNHCKRLESKVALLSSTNVRK